MPIPLSVKVVENVDKTMIGSAGLATVENGFQTELGTHTRFGKLVPWASLGDNGRCYLSDFRGNLIGTTSTGRLYSINRGGVVTDKTETVIPGQNRHIFSESEDELVIAAGAKPIRFTGAKTEILSEDAPLTTHIAYIDGYFVAIETGTGRFYHSEAGLGRDWPALNVFAANSSPDKLTSLLVTPYRELLLGGVSSIEQFERNSGGTFPFFRRWSVGEGIIEPYVMTFADNAVYCMNKKREIVRFAGQSSISVGDDIGITLGKIDDWRDTWMGGHPENWLPYRGQKFLIIQMPYATNEYGTKGITFLYDFRLQRNYRLYGWDADLGVPTRWPGWSHHSLWNRHFVGGEGVIYELTDYATE